MCDVIECRWCAGSCVCVGLFVCLFLCMHVCLIYIHQHCVGVHLCLGLYAYVMISTLWAALESG